jgi:hypothetical protein
MILSAVATMKPKTTLQMFTILMMNIDITVSRHLVAFKVANDDEQTTATLMQIKFHSRESLIK